MNTFIPQSSEPSSSSSQIPGILSPCSKAIDPATLQSLRDQRRKSALAAVLIAILSCVLLGLLFYFFKIVLFSERTEPMVAFHEELVVEEEVEQEKITTEVQKRPTSPSSSAVPIVTAAASTTFSIPSPEVSIDSLALDFGQETGFGDGWGGGTGFGAGSGKGGMSTLFGRIGGGGLQGTFHDLKLTDKKKISEVGKAYQRGGYPGKAAYEKELSKMISSAFSARKLDDYYQAETKLSYTHLVMPQMDASAAPKAFQAPECKGSGWIVKYHGKINPKEDGYYRFAGIYDDVMIVFVNGKLVLDASWAEFKSPKSVKTIAAKGTPTLVYPNSAKAQPLRYGKFIKLDGGEELTIIIGESPGGKAGGGLFVEKKGETYGKHSSGANILPPFTTQTLTDKDVARLKGMPMPVETDKVPVFHVH